MAKANETFRIIDSVITGARMNYHAMKAELALSAGNHSEAASRIKREVSIGRSYETGQTTGEFSSPMCMLECYGRSEDQRATFLKKLDQLEKRAEQIQEELYRFEPIGA